MTRNASTQPHRFSRLAVVLTVSVASVGIGVPSMAQTTPDVTIDLCGTTGTTTFPDATTATVWGYVPGDCSASPAISAPGGPTLTVSAGQVVQVNLHNSLPAASSILFQGQSIVPDRVGAAPGDTTSYTFKATNPGTYLYEAGLVPGAQYQVAMGLYGALIVEPTTAGQAYDNASTAYDDQAVLVLSELDPALNNSSTPATFDMRRYSPKYSLINGKAYPATDAIPTMAGNRVLLRYVNAGNIYHSMGILGERQNIIALDGSPLSFSRSFLAETFGPGQTTDAIVTIPSGTPDLTRFAIYDASLLLHNSGIAGFGGMLTFLTIGGTPTTNDTTGPATTDVAFGGSDIMATVDDTATGGSNIIAAEYYIDSTNGTPTAMAPSDGTFDTSTEMVTAGGALSPGSHTIYVRGQDSFSNWGAFATKTIVIPGGDTTGPQTIFPLATPTPNNGSVDLVIHATGDDRTNGGSAIAAAEYFIDTVGADGAGIAMAVNKPSSVASLDATIVGGTGAGATIWIHSQDSSGNWGPVISVSVTVDTAGPSTSVVEIGPNPNNGKLGINLTTPSARVDAVVSDSTSTIRRVEGFIGSTGANGTGFALAATDGVLDELNETVFTFIPLTTIKLLPDGDHTISVHGQDSSGNWGAFDTTILTVDKTPPTISAATLSATTINVGTATVALNITATDGTGTGLAGGEYWIDGNATRTAFSGTSATINTASLPVGVHTVSVRMKDVLTNWSATTTAYLTIAPVANNDFRTIGANGSTTQTSDANVAAGVLTNDLPIAAAGRTVKLASAPVRTAGSGSGTITLSCPGSLGTAATPTISGNTICTNGAYRVTITGVGSNGNARRGSKLGSYQFTYTLTLNGVSSTATVTINVN